jgi:hypothetical protein
MNKTCTTLIPAAVVTGVLALMGWVAAQTLGEALEQGFRHPPDSAKLRTCSISKKWPIGAETRRLEFRFEIYNAWNHTQFSSVATTALFAPDGSHTNQRFGQFTAANPARIIQAGLRFAL